MANRAVDASKYIADMGYDSERNHRLVRDDLDTHSIIPPRNKEIPIYRTRGKYRKEMKRGFDKRTYNQRVKVETVNSLVKMKMGENIYSKKVSTQNRELELRYIAYNAKRVVKINFYFFILCEVFYSPTAQ